MAPLVVFDLDGTLVDSRRDLAESANEMLASYGAAPLDWDAVAAMVGDGARELVRRALRSIHATGAKVDLAEALDRFLAIYSDRLVQNTRPYDGIPEVVSALGRRASLAVLTNKPEGLSRRLLETFGLSQFFSEIIGGDSAFPRKPDPGGLLHLIESCRSTPHETAMVGDSMVDVETGRRAGTIVVAAAYGFGQLREPLSLRAGELTAQRPVDLLAILPG